jgi:hypothetical protein
VKYAVLIDAGFIKRKLGSQSEPTTLAQIVSFLDRLKSHSALAHLSLHRIYWYDAPPLESSARRPLKGGRVDFSRTALAENSAEMLEHADVVLDVIAERARLRRKSESHAA